jgi:HK97 family phage major capsid protein
MNTVELRQKRANLIRQAREVVELAEKEGRGMVAEETQKYDAIMTEVTSLGETIARGEQMAAMEANLQQPIGDAEKPEAGAARDDGKLKEATKRWLQTGKIMPELRALQADADAAGGYTVMPELFVNRLIKAIDDLVFVRQYADVQRVTTAASLGQPYLAADPADPTWTSEILVGSEDSTMTFGKRELTPHPLAQYIKVSRKLLRMAPDTEGLVINRLGYKFATVEENAFLNGTGVNSPLGVFTASDDGISTGRDVSTGNTTTSIQTDGLKEAKYTLKAGYWPNARWILHRSAVKQIAKLQDSEGRYLWSDSIVNGEPDRLLGFPVHMSEYAPSTFTTGLYVGILGDFKYYHIVDALDMSIQRLDELYAATNQIGFIGRLESDGMPVLETAFVRVKLA